MKTKNFEHRNYPRMSRETFTKLMIAKRRLKRAQLPADFPQPNATQTVVIA